MGTGLHNFCLRLRKLERSFGDVPFIDEKSNYYNVIINSEILKQFLCRLILCSECLSNYIEFGDDLSVRIFYVYFMLIKYT